MPALESELNPQPASDADLSILLFGVRRSVRYHSCRRAFFDRLNNTTNVTSVLFGSAALASLLASGGRALILIAATVVTFFSAVNLVIGSTRKAREHADLAKKFVELQKQIVGCAKPTDQDLRNWTQNRLEIEAEEPPVLKVLDSMCHNDQLRADGFSREEFLDIRWYQRLLAQIRDVADHRIQKKDRA